MSPKQVHSKSRGKSRKAKPVYKATKNKRKPKSLISADTPRRSHLDIREHLQEDSSQFQPYDAQEQQEFTDRDFRMSKGMYIHHAKDRTKTQRQKRSRNKPLNAGSKKKKRHTMCKGTDVYFPIMEVMLCQIIKGFRRKGIHPTQENIRMLALNVLQFLKSKGFYEKYCPDFSDEESVSQFKQYNVKFFRASKGWVQKFLGRNECIAKFYRQCHLKKNRIKYSRICQRTVQWLSYNQTWEELYDLNDQNDWQKENKIAYVPLSVDEPVKKKAIKKQNKLEQKKTNKLKRRKQGQRGAKPAVVKSKRIEEGSQKRYGSKRPSKEVYQKNELSRKSIVEAKSRRIKKDKKGRRRSQESNEQDASRMIDQAEENDEESESEYEKVVSAKRNAGKGKKMARKMSGKRTESRRQKKGDK